jgi:hypothetical protein
MSNLSLISIMRDDPDFGKRLAKKVETIKEDKRHLVETAAEYSQRYQDEIVEGTKLRAKLLTEGASKGLSEEQILSSYGRFVPTVYTPILNMLYFLLRESDTEYAGRYQKRDEINELLLKNRQLEHDVGEKNLTSEEFRTLIDEKIKEIYEETFSTEQRKKMNAEIAKETREPASLKPTPEMVEFLYGNITLDMFNKIKKLKALSKSPNEQEAFQAYRKAVDLCKQYNLDFDRIPCYVKGQDE